MHMPGTSFFGPPVVSISESYIDAPCVLQFIRPRSSYLVKDRDHGRCRSIFEHDVHFLRSSRKKFISNSSSYFLGAKVPSAFRTARRPVVRELLSSRCEAPSVTQLPAEVAKDLPSSSAAPSSSVKHYDIVVIGSGGGAKISTPSSKLGYKVALCESGPLGGTCLNRGCIPSKMLIHTADVCTELDEAHRFEVITGPYSVDYEDLINRVAAEIDAESLSINPNIEANENIEWYREEVKFVGPKRLVTASGQEFTGDRIFVVAGGRPKIPNVPGLKDTPFITSTDALRLLKRPKKMMVLGSGYIGTELGHFFGAIGTEVHMLCRSRLLSAEDREVADEFTSAFSHRYNVHHISQITSVSYDSSAEEFTTTCTDRAGNEVTVTADTFLVAAGTQPNSDLLDLHTAGIEVDEHGWIKVDDYLRTSTPDVWAFGDIVGTHLFRHAANYQGEYLLETVIRGAPAYPISYVGMPHAVFSYPQVAGVGETEEQLVARGAAFVKGVNKYKNSAMGMALRSEYGLVKLLIERGTRRILGCHIVGYQASAIIHQVIPLMRLEGTLDDLLYSIFIHPALNEILRNAARKARDALVAAGDDLPLLLQLK